MQRERKIHLCGIRDDQIIHFGRMLVIKHRGNPEEELCAAILLEAMCDFLIGRYTTQEDFGGMKWKTLQVHAAEWFSSRREDYIFTFVNICETLNLDPERIHELLLNSGDPSCNLPG